MIGSDKNKDSKTKTNGEEKGNNFSVIALYLLVGISSIATLILTLLMVVPAWQQRPISSIYLLPLVLVFGVVDLVAVLVLASGALQYWNKKCEKEALGLPAGSIRALIALILIVIFAIIVVFMQTQLVAVPLKYANGTYVTDLNGVVQYTQQPQALKDLSLQTLTTVSTLVVAVAGFYFGSRAVESAAKAVGNKEIEETKEESITIDPKNLKKMKSNEELPINVKPENIALSLPQIDGDIPKSLYHNGELNNFIYTPSASNSSAERIVTITFAAKSDPKNYDKLTIIVERTNAEIAIAAKDAAEKVAKDKVSMADKAVADKDAADKEAKDKAAIADLATAAKADAEKAVTAATKPADKASAEQDLKDKTTIFDKAVAAKDAAEKVAKDKAAIAAKAVADKDAAEKDAKDKAVIADKAVAAEKALAEAAAVKVAVSKSISPQK
jgi:hypothetical protein